MSKKKASPPADRQVNVSSRQCEHEYVPDLTSYREELFPVNNWATFVAKKVLTVTCSKCPFVKMVHQQ